MANLPAEYNRPVIENELRAIRQLIDDLKTVHYFIPLSAAPVSPAIGDIVYSDGTNTDNTFGNGSEGLFRFGLNEAWHKVG